MRDFSIFIAPFPEEDYLIELENSEKWNPSSTQHGPNFKREENAIFARSASTKLQFRNSFLRRETKQVGSSQCKGSQLNLLGAPWKLE